MSIMLKTIPLIITACLTLSACDKPRVDVPPDEPVPQSPPEVPGMPAAQRAQLNTIGDCAAFQKVAGFSDWRGKVSDIEISSVTGQIDITVYIGGGLHVEQVVRTTDPIFQAVSAVHVDDEVRMSGRFVHGNAECGYRLDDIGVTFDKIGPA